MASGVISFFSGCWLLLASTSHGFDFDASFLVYFLTGSEVELPFLAVSWVTFILYNYAGFNVKLN